MLTFPHNWQEITWGAIAVYVFRQVIPHPQMAHLGECLAWASVDLTAMRSFGLDRFEKEVAVLSRSTWRINDSVYAYIQALDDEATASCDDLVKRVPAVVVLVPPNHKIAFRRALCECVTGNRTPTVLSLDEFLNYRMVMTPHALGMPTNLVLYILATRYNVHAMATHSREALEIEIPRCLEEIAALSFGASAPASWRQ